MGLYQFIRNRLALARACHYDNKLGIEAEKGFEPEIDTSFFKDGEKYGPSFYGRLERMVDYLKLGKEDVFIDLGCSKGRVVFFVALQKIKKVIGVELNKDLIVVAQKNLKNLKLRNSPIEFAHIDAADFDVRECTVFSCITPLG